MSMRRTMSLRKKTLMIILIALVMTIGVLYPVASRILLRGFLSVEEQEVRQDTVRVQDAVTDEIDILEQTARGWAERDDTYRFIEDRNQQYVQSALSDAMVASLQIDALAFIELSGDVVYGVGYDPVAGETIPLPDSVAASQSSGDLRLDNTSLATGTRGLLLLPEGPMLVAANPIIDGRGSGAARGWLVMGRWFDQRLIDRIAERTHLPFTVYRSDAPVLPEDVSKARADLSEVMAVATQRLTPTAIAGYASINDLPQTASLILRVEQPRTIYGQAMATIQALFLAFLVISVALSILGWLIADRMILSRLDRLTAAVQRIGARGDPGARVRLSGNDELSYLAASINRTLDSLERSRAARQQIEARYRAVVEQTSEGIMLVEAASKRIVEVNSALERMVGYSAADLTQRTLYEIVTEEPHIIDDFVKRRSVGGDHFVGERHQLRSDGTFIDLEVRVSPIAYGDATLLCFVAHDITDRKRSERRNAVFADLGQQLSAAGSAVDTAHIIAAAADELIGWDAFALSLYDAPTDQMHAVLTIDLIDGERTAQETGFEPHTPSAMSRRTLTEGAQLLLDQPSGVDLVPFGDPARRSASLMFVPLRHGDRTVGIMTIQRYTPGAYTPTNLETLQMLADHCGGALERVQVQEALRASEERFRTLVDNLPGVVYRCAYDEEWTDEFISESVIDICGYPASDFINGQVRGFGSIIHPDDRELVQRIVDEKIMDRQPFEVEYRIMHADGSIRWIYEKGVTELDEHGEVRWIEGALFDVTEHKQTLARVQQLVYYDDLTGLPNRALFQDRLQQALAQAQRSRQQVALLWLDLDRFKYINDTLGHHTGDLLIEAVAQRLRKCVRDGDTIARMGGDEFAIVLLGVGDMQHAAEMSQCILDTLSKPVVLEGRALFVSASIGISVFPNDGADVPTLVRYADTAMYRAKELGRNGFQFYAPMMNAAAHRRLEVEQHLHHALERNEFVVYYQPRINLHSGRLVGMEALLRWNHPTWGIVPPLEFIPMAEEIGLIARIGEWVLSAACAQAKVWQERGTPLRVAVNLSAYQLQHTDLAQLVERVLDDLGLDPAHLELEVTESNAMHHADHTVVVLRALKSMGVHLSLDDFGTGYSSLSYLKQFPIDTLKIDQSFVRDLPHDSTIVEAIIALAHSLDLSVTAEGAETEEQFAFLRHHQCDELQGYVLGRPVAPDEFEALYLHEYALAPLLVRDV